jgi:hypothetical protein
MLDAVRHFASWHVALSVLGNVLGIHVEKLSPESLSACSVVLTELHTFDVRRSAATLYNATANCWYKILPSSEKP